MDKNKNSTLEPPKLAKRREHKNSSFLAGRTIGERREKLETANERAAARKKDKHRKVWRIVTTIVVFLGLVAVLIILFLKLVRNGEEVQLEEPEVSFSPTIEIIDENSVSGGQITTRMKDYIGQVEADLKLLGINPVRAVVPSGSIREIRFYLEGYTGYVKMLVDRGAGVSSEDVGRMLKYLSETGVNDFEYIDVRIEGKAYWK